MANENKSKEKAIKKIKKLVDKYVSNFIKQSEKTGNTPDLEDTQRELRSMTEESIMSDKEISYLSMEDIADIRNECLSYCNQVSKEAYNKSLQEHPRNINGASPIPRDPSTNVVVNKETIIQRIKNLLDAGLAKFLQICIKTKKCPDEPQMSTYLDGMIASAMRQVVPANISDKDKTAIEKAIKKYKEILLGKYREFARERQITHTLPTEAELDSILPKKTVVQEQKKLRENFIESNTSFSGCDMVVDAQIWIDGEKYVSTVMGSLATVSYSIFQQKFPINAIGNVNAKDYVMGPRTIAGSLVFIVFNQHWATELLRQFAEAMGWPSSKKVLIDEIAPIDLTISMCNEYGYRSRLAIYGVRLFSEGQVMSINDMYTENTYQYVALNIDYLTDIEGENENLSSSNEEKTAKKDTNVPTLKIPNNGGQQKEPKDDEKVVEAYALKGDPKEVMQLNDTVTEYNTAIQFVYNHNLGVAKQDLNQGKITQEQYNSIVQNYQETMMKWSEAGVKYYQEKAKKDAADAKKKAEIQQESQE